jgi:hypothetical protein
MDLGKYFTKAEGVGYLATSGAGGDVDIAVYSRPHVMKDDTLAFGMTDRLTYANLRVNPKAVYAFNEGGFRGRRLFLEKIREESAGPLLEEIRSRVNDIVRPGSGSDIRFVVYFRVTNNIPLVGP